MVLSWMMITLWGSDLKSTPCQASRPASVTTKEGTPRKATNEPWNAPIAAPARIATRIASRPGIWWPLSGIWSSAATTAARPLTEPIERSISPSRSTKTTPNAMIVEIDLSLGSVSDREVDLPEQKHEDDAERDDRGPRHLHDHVVEVRRADVRRVLEVEEEHDDHQRDDDRAGAQLARAEVVPHAAAELPDRNLRLGARRCALGADAQAAGSSALPAVIASTICVGVYERENVTP